MAKPSLSSAPTVAEIIHFVNTVLNPETALQYANGRQESFCVTPLIAAITQDDGTVVELNRFRRESKNSLGLIADTHGPLYGGHIVRVSSEQQKSQEAGGEGWSIDWQVELGVRFYLNKGWAFRIFSDAGLSASLPINDPKLIREMWTFKARIYRDACQKVFFDAGVIPWDRFPQNDPNDGRRGMEHYMEGQFEKMMQIARNGVPVPFHDHDDIGYLDVDGAGDDLGNSLISEESEEGDEEEEELPMTSSAKGGRFDKSLYRGQRKRKAHLTYRPGLTALWRCIEGTQHNGGTMNDSPEADRLRAIHHVTFSDFSRLTRSEIMTTHLAAHFAQHNVSVTGLFVPCEWMGVREGDGSSSELGKTLIRTITAFQAQERLMEVKTNSLRGMVTSLKNGTPHGKTPFWLRRDPKTKKTDFIDERVTAVNRILDLFEKDALDSGIDPTWKTRQTDMGAGKIANILMDEGHTAPGAHGRDSKRWGRSAVKRIMASPALMGRQHRFGIYWEVFPVFPDMTRERWNRLQAKIAYRAREYKAMPPHKVHLASELLTCHCGSGMHHNPQNAGKYKDGRPKIYNQYMCSVSPAKRRELPEGYPHILMQEENVHKFLELLIREDGQNIVNFIKNDEERSRHDLEIKDMIRRLEQWEIEAPLQKESARQRALEVIPPSKRNNEAIINAFVEDDEEFAAFLEKLEECRKTIRTQQQIISRLLPTDNIGSLQERVAIFDSLSEKDKNDTLHRLFKEIRFHGFPPNETMVMYVNTTEENTVAPISLKTITMGVGSDGKVVRWRRRLPETMNEWIDACKPVIPPNQE